jgi:hypothetical protein
MKNAKRPRYVVVLTPARGVDDGVKRLRHLLKVAGREDEDEDSKAGDGHTCPRRRTDTGARNESS